MSVRGIRVHVYVLEQGHTDTTKEKKNLNMKMKAFPGSDQKSETTFPSNRDLDDFKASLRIRIRHDQDEE